MRLRPALLTTLAALAGVGGAVAYSVSAFSADHQDSPATANDPTADINDVYTWMDGTNAILAMTVYPNAPTGDGSPAGAAQFSDSVQYVFHTASTSTFTTKSTKPVDVIATFNASQQISLWVGGSEYLTGDASQPTGLSSADGKVKVFAGLRADPFFFNLEGFKAVVGDVIAAAPSLSFTDAGCPLLEAGTSTALVMQLGASADGGPATNHFATFNGLAIVVSIDKSLLTAGGNLVSVWGGTYSTASSVDAGGQ